MTYFSKPFVILADTADGIVKRSRHNRASAMCLADDWAEVGYTNVRIVNQDGLEQNRRQFWETLLLVRLARRRAVAII